MAIQDGAKLVLKIGDGASPVENFTLVGGFQTTRMVLGRQMIDSSSAASGAWRELSAGGAASLSIQGNGLFTNSAAEAALRAHALAGTIRRYQLLFGNGEVLETGFRVARYESGGNLREPESFTLALESSGEVVYA